jgi:hypothetical protein
MSIMASKTFKLENLEKTAKTQLTNLEKKMNKAR